MRIFDSNGKTSWSGRGIQINKGTLTVSKSAVAEHATHLVRGKHFFKIIGKKRTGNGKVKISVIVDGGIILLEEDIVFSKSSWTEVSFNFDVKKDYGKGKIRISRANGFGTIEIGRAVLERINEEKVESASNSKASKAQRLNRISRGVAEEPLMLNGGSTDYRRRMAFIIPYGIFGGAEVYIGNIIKKINTELYDITILYMSKNSLREYLEGTNIAHRICRSFEQLSGVLVSTPFDYVIYYNRADVYNTLSKLKKTDAINSKLIEIYHSDFEWTGSLSKIKKRENVDLIFRVADDLAEDITGIRNKSIITIPVGIDVDKFNIKETKMPNQIKKLVGNNTKFIIGTVARLSKEKNINYLLDMAKIMDDSLFIIVGSGPDGERLQARKRDERISNVVFSGFNHDVSKFYNIFDAFVLASEIEGTPISILEAMASGVPVFTNMVGSIPKIIQDKVTGFKISGNPKDDTSVIYENIFNMNVINNARKFMLKKHDININSNLFMESILEVEDFYFKIDKKTKGIKIKGEYI